MAKTIEGARMIRHVKGFFCGLVCLLCVQVNWAMPDISVHGLFGKNAVLVINGKQRMLKQGQTSPEGVKLVSSDGQQVVLDVDGRRLTLGLSQHISSSFQAAEMAEIRIPRGHNGHYFVTGYINGHATDFMVDTGASAVVLNINQAKALGIDYRNGERIKINTASGMADARDVVLGKLAIGNITLYNIRCIVNISSHPTIALLGNSFLSKVQMTESEGVLLLKKKF
jgi:aspartyl protease family protein